MTKTQKTLMVILIILVVGLLARLVFFKDQFDKWSEGLNNVSTWQKQYKAEHPNATKEDMNNAFDENMTKLKEWQDQYKVEHPGATDAEVDAAFNAQFK